MVWITIAALLVAVAACATSQYLIIQNARSTQQSMVDAVNNANAAIVESVNTANKLIVEATVRENNDAKEIAKAGIEASSRYGALVLQTASALRTNIDAAVAQRVKLINSVRNPGEPEEKVADPVGDAPIRTTGMVDEVHEIGRELTRTIREGAQPVREEGVGGDFGTPMEI